MLLTHRYHGRVTEAAERGCSLVTVPCARGGPAARSCSPPGIFQGFLCQPSATCNKRGGNRRKVKIDPGKRTNSTGWLGSWTTSARDGEFVGAILRNALACLSELSMREYKTQSQRTQKPGCTSLDNKGAKEGTPLLFDARP